MKKTTEEFIIDAYCKHQDKYNYSSVVYKDYKTKLKIICHEHGIFKQLPYNHLKGCGCPECAGNKKKTISYFIKKSKLIHGNKYDYSLVEKEGYSNTKTKVKIICPKHGIFEQRIDHHLQGCGCPKCAGKFDNKYASNNIPLYDTYVKQLQPYGIECRRNKDDKNILEVKCMYCGRWFIPFYKSIIHKIQCINGKGSGENNLYCSTECKKACPTYHQKLYPKGYKINTSREVQPALRKLVLKRDNYTCQKCGAINKELHCHHYEGIEVNPIESADMDNCIILCIDCHHDIHSKDKCGMKDYKSNKC